MLRATTVRLLPSLEKGGLEALASLCEAGLGRKGGFKAASFRACGFEPSLTLPFQGRGLTEYWSLVLGGDDARRNAGGAPACRDVDQHDGVSADARVGANHDGAKNFRACADVDVAFKSRRALAPFAHAKRDLLHDQAVDANGRLRMNDNAVRMRDHQPAADLRVERNVGAGHSRPETVTQHDDRAAQRGQRAGDLLVVADRLQQLSPRVPKPARGFARPVRNLRKVVHLETLTRAAGRAATAIFA